MSKETNCKFCNNPVKIYEKRRNVTFSNIQQNPSVIYFCSIKCKSEWIYEIQEKQNWNQLEEKYFQETGKNPYKKKYEYEKWSNERLEHLKRTFEQITKIR